MKKIIYFLLITSIVLSFSGCNNGSEEKYTVWLIIDTASQFELVFNQTIDQGTWIYKELNSSQYEEVERGFSSVPQTKNTYSELVNTFKQYVPEREAESKVSWLISTDHGYIAVRSAFSDSVCIAVK